MPRGGRSLPALLSGIFAWALARRLPVPGAPALVIDDSWHGAPAHGRLFIEGRLATLDGEIDLVAAWQRRALDARPLVEPDAPMPFPVEVDGTLLLRGGVSGWLLDEVPSLDFT